MNFLKGSTVVGMLVLASTAAEPSSAFTIYDNRADWEEAVTGSEVVTDTFDCRGGPPSRIYQLCSGITSIAADDDGWQRNVRFNIERNHINAIRFDLVYQGGVDYLGSLRPEFITWDFPSPIYAFGGEFTEVELLTVNGDFDGVGEESVHIKRNYGGMTTSTGIPFGFLGIVGTSSFDEIVFRVESFMLRNNTDNFAIDDFSFAVGEPVQTIPEPLTILGTATAAGFGAFFKRTMNKKKKDKK